MSHIYFIFISPLGELALLKRTNNISLFYLKIKTKSTFIHISNNSDLNKKIQ